MSDLISEFERLIRRDPAHRGLIGTDAKLGPLCLGHLSEAAKHLSEFGSHIAIVTGFFIPHSQPPAAETDGPLGTIMLAHALDGIGMETRIITDERCADVIRAGCGAAEFPTDGILIYPEEPDDWCAEFFASPFGQQLSHLIAIERVGPSHTLSSLANQPRGTSPFPTERFEALVPVECRDRCHNMRGKIIDRYTADTSRLFDQVCVRRPSAKTIGIGDGGNEIGMGNIPWEELERRFKQDELARIPCRVATDWNIIAGVSNWGGYALAAAVLHLRGRTDYLRDWGYDRELKLLEHIVEHGPSVDGVTGLQEATVDGLPFVTYIQPWEGIRRLLELDQLS